MLIVCPSCLSAYRLPAGALQNAPGTIRCATCSRVFDLVQLPSVLAPHAPAVTMAPAAVAPPAIPAQHHGRSSPAATTRPSRRVGTVVAIVVALLGLVPLGLSQRDRLAPALAAVGLPLPGLKLGKVETALGDEGPVKVLTLTADITNTRSTGMRLPNVRIVVRDDTEQNLYSWVAPAPRETLGPGEAVAFHSRLVSPPANGHDLVVSLADGSETTGTISVKAER